jgi:hypothetical protein
LMRRSCTVARERHIVVGLSLPFSTYRSLAHSHACAFEIEN